MTPTHEWSAGRSVERRAPRASRVRSFVRQYECGLCTERIRVAKNDHENRRTTPSPQAGGLSG
jgi:hypothetical protein